MGRKSKKNTTQQTAKTSTTTVADGEFLQVDPQRIRFQHSRIRPYFSGCGRSVRDTLESIRKGDLRPCDLPPIQVIVGPDEKDGKGPWYFSLNNRRLWVLKQCREEGLLSTIFVRVRKPKSRSESERYSLQNCAVDAKFFREETNRDASNGHLLKRDRKEISNVDRGGGGGDDDDDGSGDNDDDKEKDDANGQRQEKTTMDAITDKMCGLNVVPSSIEPSSSSTLTLHPSNKEDDIREQQEDCDSSEEDEDDDDDDPIDVSLTTYRNPFSLGLAGGDSSDGSSSSEDDSD